MAKMMPQGRMLNLQMMLDNINVDESLDLECEKWPHVQCHVAQPTFLGIYLGSQASSW